MAHGTDSPAASGSWLIPRMPGHMAKDYADFFAPASPVTMHFTLQSP
jgi:hypothetical protein